MNNPLNELTTSQQRELYEICWRFEQELSEGKQISPGDFIPADCSLDSELLIAELAEIREDWLTSAARRQSNWPPVSDQRYELREEIARGGSAVVWRVWDRHLQRETALKCLLETQDTAAMRARLEREARLCARLVHPGIVPVHELSKFADGRPFVNMKLVEGKTLLQLLTASPPISRNAAIEIFTKVCGAMAYAHSRAIIHRDLKPSNIMVGAFGEVQIMDWGLGKDLSVHDSLEITITRAAQVDSKVAQGADQYNDVTVGDIVSESTRLDSTKQGSVIGTLAYMSPEQAQGHLDRIDRRSDVFALGAILCRILIDSPPYQGLEETQVLQQAQDCNLREVELKLRRSPDKQMAELAIRCMRSDPNARPADAKRVFDELSKIHRSRRRRKLVAVATLAVALASVVAIVARWSSNSKAFETQQSVVPAIEKETALDLSDPATIDSLFYAKQYKLAVGKYQIALAKHPDDFFLHRNICTSLIMLGRFAEAETVAHALLKLDKLGADAHFLLGDSLLNQGKFQEAYDEFIRSKACLEDGRQSTLPIDTRIAEATRKIELAERVQNNDGELPVDSMTYDEIVEIARICENSRINLAVEYYEKALTKVPSEAEQSFKRFLILAGFQRVYDRQDLSIEQRNAFVKGMLKLVSDQVEYAVTEPDTVTKAKSELRNLLRNGTELAFLRAIPGDTRVSQELRAELASILAKITSM